jgi:hypothetical protein
MEEMDEDFCKSKRVPVWKVRFLYRWAVRGLLHEGFSLDAADMAAEGKLLLSSTKAKRIREYEKN